MNSSRLLHTIATVAIAAMLALPALGTSAENPGHEWGDPEYVEGVCPFTVTVWFKGLATYKEFYDRDGNLTATRWTYPAFRIGFENEANGKWIDTRSAGSIWIRVNDDGSNTASWNGMQGKFNIPGEGLIGGSIGHVVILFLDPAPPEVLQATGHYNQEGDPFGSPWPFLCEYLA